MAPQLLGQRRRRALCRRIAHFWGHVEPGRVGSPAVLFDRPLLPGPPSVRVLCGAGPLVLPYERRLASPVHGGTTCIRLLLFFSPLCLLVSSSLSSESNNFSSSSSRMRMFYYFCSPGSGSLSLDSFFFSVNPHFLFIFPFFSVRSCSKAERGSTSA